MFNFPLDHVSAEPFLDAILKRADAKQELKLKCRLPVTHAPKANETLSALGFRQVGVERCENLLRGTWTDIILYERLHPQWQQPVGQELSIGEEELIPEPELPEPEEPQEVADVLLKS